MASSFPHLVAVVPGLKLRGLLETSRFKNIPFLNYISMLFNVKQWALFSSLA